ncbi:MAG: hypothetical protein AAF657_20715 [Acidobacteriota bacterium]
MNRHRAMNRHSAMRWQRGRRPRRRAQPRRAQPRRILAWAACGLLWPLVVAADWQDDYRAAIQTIERQQWLDAARLLRSALAARPDETVQEGQQQPYLPRYYLGLALFRMNDCLAALDQWSQSEAQGVVQATELYGRLLEHRVECERRVVLPAIEQAQQQLAGAAQYAGIARTQLDDVEMSSVWSDHPELTSSMAQALTDFAAVSAQVSAAVERKNLDDLIAADRAAEQSKLTLNELVSQAIGFLTEELDRAKEKESGAKRTSRDVIRRLVSRAAELIPRLTSRDRGVAGIRSELSELLIAATDIDPDTPMPQLDTLRQRLERTLSQAERALEKPQPPAAERPRSRPPQRLLRAAEAYFRGDYQIAVELLSQGDTFEDSRAMAQGYLFRAAARFAQYHAQGQVDETVLEDAEADVRACRSFDALLAPDSQLFSPRFRRFFGAHAGG